MLLATLSTGERATAQSLLDYIRAYDLNDYALGLTVSGSQSPYVGDDASNIAYPGLTSFRDSAFTDDWLLIREGDLGFRWVSESGWELGAVGRFQTLTLGSNDAPELEGLNDRRWTVEIGPIIGYRRWRFVILFEYY